MSVRGACLIVSVVGSLVLAASAQASTFKIGSDLSSKADGFTSTCAPCTQGVNAVSSGQVTAPCTGTITSWAIRAYSSATGGSDVKLRVLHPDGTGAYSGAGTSLPIHVGATQGILSAVTSLPITAGDGIGVDATAQTLDLNVLGATGGETDWNPPLPDGGAPQDPTNTFDNEVLVQATISCPPWTLSVSKTGSGSGTVTSADGTINCGSTCAHPGYPENALVALTATPSPGSEFTGWSGACSGTGSCTLTMNNDETVSASFALQPPQPPQPPQVPQVPRVPNTKITSARVEQRKHTARFSFKAIGVAGGFQCALITPTMTREHHNKPRFKACRSGKTYKHLKQGKYKFEVRAFDSAGHDLTPAIKKFTI